MIQSPDLTSAVSHIATAQIVIAVANAIFGIFFLGLIAAGLIAYRKATKAAHDLQKKVDGLVAPVNDAARSISADAKEVSRSVRERVNDLLQTVDEANTRLRLLVDAAEDRVKKLGTVVDVVQENTEDLLLDAAATARGVQAAAEHLSHEGGRSSHALGPSGIAPDVEE